MLYVVARPLAVIQLYRACLAPAFAALGLRLRRPEVTARGPGGEPLLYRLTVAGSFNVSKVFDM